MPVRKSSYGKKTSAKKPKTRAKNPVMKKVVARPIIGKRKPEFAVEIAPTDTGPWRTLGQFPDEKRAREYAVAYSNLEPSRWLRVALK